MKMALNNLGCARIVAMSVLIAGAGVENSIFAVEPDDFPDNATYLNVIPSAISSGILGDGLASASDVDFYRLIFDFSDPHAGFWLLEINVAGSPPLDPFLRFFKVPFARGMQEYARNDDLAFKDSNSSIRTYLILPSQLDAFYVAVSTAANPNYDPSSSARRRPGTGGAYTLTASIQRVSPPVSPYEPNDEFATFMGEGSFEVKNEFIGDGDNERDVDLYRITLTQASRLDIAVKVDAIDSPLEPVVHAFRSFGLGNATLGIRDHNDNGTRDAVLSLGISEPGDVFIAVYGNGNPILRDPEGDRGEVGSVGPYNLNVEVTPFDGSGPYEPNDSLSTATTTADSGLDFPKDSGAPNKVAISAYLGDGPYQLTHGDRDFYNIALRKSGYITVGLSTPHDGASMLDPILAFYDIQGNRLQTSYARGGTLEPMVVPLTCGPPTAYPGEPPANWAGTLMVMGNGQRFPNDPYVPLDNSYHDHPEEFSTGDGPGSMGPYSLNVSWHDANDACGKEPDDTIALATDTGLIDSGTYLCTNSYMGDSDCPTALNDVDFWKFTVRVPPANVHMQVVGCNVIGQAYPLDYASIRLFDGVGHELGRAGGNTSDLNYPDKALLDVLLENAGTYYVGVSAWVQSAYDPSVPCSIIYSYDKGNYDLLIRLTALHAPDKAEPSNTNTGEEHEPLRSGSQMRGVFASEIARGIGTIEVLDSTNGQVTNEFDAPEITFGGAEGLATDGSSLFFTGSGLYPRIYQLDPHSGQVQSDFILSYGSGFYSDATMLGGELFALDYREGTIHVLDPISRQLHRTLPIASRYGVRLGGGLASASYPNRLYVADAFGTGNIYEIEPQSGAITRTLPPPENRPIALAGVDNTELWAADWLSTSVSLLDRATGVENASLTLASAVSSMSSTASPHSVYDVTYDGNIDLRDIELFQNCFSGPFLVQPECQSNDTDGNGHVDLNDFAGLGDSLSGP